MLFNIIWFCNIVWHSVSYNIISIVLCYGVLHDSVLLHTTQAELELCYVTSITFILHYIIASL